ncbi:MAG: 3-isopropylmalate dehydrogenase [Sulfobacillus acidophilus]|uniref:3-isopropylmalate dehydrogenase n=1 Tax=Sulfobacillus acidophilus TaxID=53633 RepID=A0A2T2WKN7_9FIRM|nr:MAG: 3-isopropylmalate dehydrogenase [Sulfobacillus acidophilus]
MGHHIAVLPGDGIGPEVTEQALRLLEEVSRLGQFTLEATEGLIGGRAIDETGDPFPPASDELVHRTEATLLGAVGGPKWAQGPATPEQGLLRLRASLGLFANIRPFEVLPGLEAVTPLKRPFAGGVIIRELLGGLYYGEPRGRLEREAFDTSRYTTSEIERVARLGFELAKSEGVPLISIDKANVLQTSKLWRDTVTRLGQAEYPTVRLEHRYVDAAAMEMVIAPERFKVVVTENLFGDILSDLTGGLVGSLGVLGSATVSQWSQGRGLYEPIHGSAPDIAGKGIANPIGALWSCALMLEWSLAKPEAGAFVKDAIRRTVAEGICTPDIGGSAGTAEVADAVIRHLHILAGASR